MNRMGMRVAAALGAAVLVAGCAAQGADKAGSEARVLRLASIDEVNDNGQSFGPQAFIDALAEVSGGRFTVEVDESFGDGRADAESQLVQAIAAGEVDGGWPATRAFAAAGIPGLQAVEAPLTITSYAAQKALVSGPAAGTVLASLDGTDVVGLGLAVGPLRRPFAAGTPLLGPEDWAGARFRSFNSPVQTEAITALGASPVSLGFEWVDEARAGSLRGVEFDVAQYATNGLSTEAGQVTGNVVLWPKVFVLSLHRPLFDSLSDEQREWIREAGRRAVQATVDATYDEATPARALCDAGTRFVDAGPDQIGALRARVQPVLDRLAADPAEAPVLREVLAVAAAHPAPDVVGPAGCRDATGQVTEVGPIPAERAKLPDGVYRVEITPSEVVAAGILNDGGWAGTWTLTISAGTYVLGCRPASDSGEDCGHNDTSVPLEAGDLYGTGDTVIFSGNSQLLAELAGCKLPPSTTLADHCGPPNPYRMTWTADEQTLTFGDQAGWSNFQFLIEPWRKIA